MLCNLFVLSILGVQVRLEKVLQWFGLLSSRSQKVPTVTAAAPWATVRRDITKCCSICLCSTSWMSEWDLPNCCSICFRSCWRCEGHLNKVLLCIGQPHNYVRCDLTKCCATYLCSASWVCRWDLRKCCLICLLSSRSRALTKCCSALVNRIITWDAT